MSYRTMIPAMCAALAWTVGNMAYAVPVGTDDAAYAVDAWVVRGGTLGAQLGGVVRVDAHMPANGAKFYAVKTSGGGTVFTSADTEVEPIMAFTSAKDDFSKIDEKSPLWALLACERSVARPSLMTAAKSATNGQSAAATKWSELIAEGKARAAAAANGVVFPAKAGSGGTASGLSAAGDVRVAPLLPTKWYQLGDGAGAPCYNYYVPNGYYCGCVATAMSQIMYKHRFPSPSVTPVDKECFVDDVAAICTMKGGSYNWNLMPLEPNAKACTETEREAVGRLTYDAGVSVCMDWCEGGSGAMACLVGDAFREVFGYGQAVYYRVDQGLGDGEGLQKAVYSNLDAGYPVMFGICYSNWRGDKSNGHSIVGDGYGYNNGKAYLHLNMGWAGQDDLWYAMPEINTSNGSFNWIEDIVYNIFPQATPATAAFSGRALLPNGKPAVGAAVKIYRSSDNLLVTNLSVNAAGVWGALVETGTYNVDVELSAYGFVGAVSNMFVTAATTTSKSFYCAVDASGLVTRTYDCTRHVSYVGDLGNSWGNDITVSGKLSGTTLEWTEPQLLEATQFADFQHAFAVSGGDAPYNWSVATRFAVTRGEGSSFDGASGTAPFTYLDFEAGGASVTLPFAVPVRGKLCDRIVAETGGSIRIGDLRVRIENIWGEANHFYVANSERAVTLRWGDSASMTFTDDGMIRVAFSESFGEGYNLPASRVVASDCNTAEVYGEFVPVDEGETNADVVFSPRALPPGLALDAATGVLSGRAEAAGESSFTVTVLDVGGQTLSRDFTLTVSPSANAQPVISGCEPSAEGYVDVVDGEEQAFYVFAQDDTTSAAELVYTWEVDGNTVGSFAGSNGISYSFELDPENSAAPRRHTVVCYVSDGVWTRQVKQVWNVRVIKVNYVDAAAEEDWEVMDGSPEHPWTQIADATAYASAGDIVYVRPGTYRPFGGENCEIRVIALGGPSVTFVDAEGDGPCYSCYGGVYDEELGMEIPGRKVRIEGFTFINGYQGYGQAAGANGGTLVNCVIKDCSAARASEWSSACIGGAFGSKLVNCVIVNCSGEDCGGAFDCDLYNCNVIGNRSSNGPAGIDSRSAAYNTVFGNSFGEDVENGAVTENCLTGRDPLFVDPVNGDFRLCAGSPCLDAGDNAWLVEGVTNDLAGATRVQNGIVDIGAYEGTVGDHPPTKPLSQARRWMTVDLVSGIVSYHDYDFTTATNVFNTEEYKSTKMAFRRVPAGFYYYVQNGVYTAQMEKPYYIGMFEVTVAQYALMSDAGYQFSYNTDLRAKGQLNRERVRGTRDSASAFGQGIVSSSPLGLLNARVQAATATNLVFDLPTEAMWEVAARAVASGDATRQNCKWYFGEDESLLSAHAFVAGSSTSDDYGNTVGMRVPGCKLPNEWGLYDIYGNAREVCLDGLSGAVDKVSPYGFGEWTQVPLAQGVGQRGRGAAYDDDASQANSAYCRYYDYDWYNQSGVRLALICTDEGSDAVCVPKSVTGGSDLYVPYAWFAGYPAFVTKFGDDYTAAAVMPTGKRTADGSPAYVWQDFVNGCDPTNPEDVFRATIEFADGEPSVGWEPYLNSNGINRIYRILGKAELADGSGDWRRYRSGDRFFKVSVAMPDGVSSSDEPGSVARERNLLCHLSFDDYGNDGLNVLKVDGGGDAIVRTTPANDVSGLGEVTVVTDSEILAGLEPGDGAVCIPRGTHLALPMPKALLDREGHPYTIKMRVKFPRFGKYYSLLNMPASNDSDAMVFLTSANAPVITMKLTDKGPGGGIAGSGGFTANQWEEVTLQFGAENTKVLLNGSPIFSYDVNLSTSCANCCGAREYFVISGDNDSDDNAMYWADVKVYDGIVD